MKRARGCAPAGVLDTPQRAQGFPPAGAEVIVISDEDGSSAILWLDPDAVEAVLQRGSLQAAGRLSSSCSQLMEDCTPWLARIQALTAQPLSLPPSQIFGLRSRVHLSHRWGGIGDAGVGVLARGCASGAFALCERLYLNHSQVGDVGFAALATASARGALPRLTLLNLMGNHIGDEGLCAAASACAHGSAWASLWDLWLSGNRISSKGLTALAAACAKRGALAGLTSLTLGQNEIGDEGITALAAALEENALPNLRELGVDPHHAQGHRHLQQVARGPRSIALPL